MKSEMRDMTESLDWSQTPLGPRSNWPVSLRTVVDIILNSQMPMHLSWGKELIQFYNDANRLIIGDHHPLLGKSFFKTWPQIHEKMLPLINRVMSGEALYFSDFVGTICRNGNDEECHFSLSMTPVQDDEGKIAGVLTTHIETTQEIEKNKLLEYQKNELHNFFMQAPMPLVILEGEELRFVLANPPYEKMIGRSTKDKTVLEVFTREEVDHFMPIMMDVYKYGVPHIMREQPLNITDSNGNMVEKWLDVGFYPFKDINGKIKGQFAIVVDITNVVLAKQQIESALKSRDEFISIASHEFKTPVSSLKLQFQMFERNLKKGIPLTEEALNKMLNLSLRQIDSLSRLIEDLLDATKASNQRMTFKFKNVDLTSIAYDAITSVSQFAADHETPIEAHIEENVDLYCDPFRIEQVITNLLTNASKYGDYKTISIVVKKVNDKVKIIVTDHGIGIPPENHLKIFERFERGSVTKNYAGLGLGLYITKHIVDAHGGTIQLDSEPGQGSVFTVSLPIV